MVLTAALNAAMNKKGVEPFHPLSLWGCGAGMAIGLSQWTQSAVQAAATG